MLTDEQVAFFNANGYVTTHAPILSGSDVQLLRDALAEVIAGTSPDCPHLLRNMAGGELDSDKVVVQIVNIWQAHPAFRAHISHAAIVDMVLQLMSTETLRVWHDQIQYKPPSTGSSTKWHQDFPAWPVLNPADLVTAWVALDDATLANGCLQFVPGSHLWGDNHVGLATNADFSPEYDLRQLPLRAKVDVVPVEVPKGAVSFHHCAIWHASAPNPSDRHRRAIAVHYMPGSTRYVAAGNHIMDSEIKVRDGEILEGDHFPVIYPR